MVPWLEVLESMFGADFQRLADDDSADFRLTVAPEDDSEGVLGPWLVTYLVMVKNQVQE